MSAARRPLPPHARELAEARRRGMTLRTGYVAISLDWWRPKAGVGVCCPPDRDPAQLDWSWIRDLDCIVWRRGEPLARLRAVLGAIRIAKPRSVAVIDTEFPEDGDISASIYSIVRVTDGEARAA